MRQLSENEIRLLIGLLDDEDSRSQELVCRQILELGKPVLPYLEEAYGCLGLRWRRTLDSLVCEIRRQELENDFRLFAAAGDPDLERGAFLVARVASPAFDEKKCAAWLDATARTVDPGPMSETNHEILLRRFNDHFFKTLGFRGNQKNYYDPANSAIDRVIESRQGIPIFLCVLYLLVGWRLKLPLSGVGLPGHFVVRFDGSQGAVFIDPFHGGRMLTRQGCRQFLHSLGQGFRDEYLFPLTNRDMLARMLRNLILIYQRAGHPERVQQLSSMVEILLTRNAPGLDASPSGGRSAEIL